ncbi:MAG: hypothetical protein ACOY9I_04545 [Pseudomonadota bacterium]
MSVKCHLCGQRRTDDTNGGGVCRCAGGYSAYHDIQKKADAFDDELRFQREIANLRHDIERHVGIATEATQEVEQLRAELAASREREARMQSRDAQWVAFASEVGKRVGCLASTFPDANDHVLRKLPPPAALAEGAQG